jgi:RNA polymerase sigma factor (sigma-70 family)
MKRHPDLPSQRARWSDRPDVRIIKHPPLGLGEASFELPPFELGDVRHAIETLPREDRELLLLYWLRGLDYADIARELNLPLSRIRSRVASAKTALRAIIGYGIISGPSFRRPAPRRR